VQLLDDLQRPVGLLLCIFVCDVLVHILLQKSVTASVPVRRSTTSRPGGHSNNEQ
jgi:hypothetical protein